MDTSSLKCPLCCEETFPSPESLKYHILSLTENLLCPSCDKRFYNLYDLTEHLGRRCTDHNVDESAQERSTNVEDSGKTTFERLIPKVEVVENEDAQTEETYFCHVCNINILSIQEHLENCHQGEEIIVVRISKQINLHFTIK